MSTGVGTGVSLFTLVFYIFVIVTLSIHQVNSLKLKHIQIIAHMLINIDQVLTIVALLINQAILVLPNQLLIKDHRITSLINQYPFVLRLRLHLLLELPIKVVLLLVCELFLEEVLLVVVWEVVEVDGVKFLVCPFLVVVFVFVDVGGVLF